MAGEGGGEPEVRPEAASGRRRRRRGGRGQCGRGGGGDDAHQRLGVLLHALAEPVAHARSRRLPARWGAGRIERGHVVWRRAERDHVWWGWGWAARSRAVEGGYPTPLARDGGREAATMAGACGALGREVAATGVGSGLRERRCHGPLPTLAMATHTPPQPRRAPLAQPPNSCRACLSPRPSRLPLLPLPCRAVCTLSPQPCIPPTLQFLAAPTWAAPPATAPRRWTGGQPCRWACLARSRR